ncbi:MAG: hypothetical protein IPN18_09155 [Ignavibacteriales bacterium]|nr:hypothetical protein [Ignavibacteriales bacterium]
MKKEESKKKFLMRFSEAGGNFFGATAQTDIPKERGEKFRVNLWEKNGISLL